MWYNKIMKLTTFLENLEEEKKKMYGKSWSILNECLSGEEISREQIDTSKYIINRKDGMPSQKILGDENSPLILKLNDEQLNQRIKEIENGIADLQGREVKEKEKGKSENGSDILNGENTDVSENGKDTQGTGKLPEREEQKVGDTSSENAPENNNDNNKLGNSTTDTQ